MSWLLCVNSAAVNIPPSVFPPLLFHLRISLCSCPSPSTVEEPLFLETVTFLCLPWFTCQLVFPPPPCPSGPSCTARQICYLQSYVQCQLCHPRPSKSSLYPHHPFPFRSNVSASSWNSGLLSDGLLDTLTPCPSRPGQILLPPTFHWLVLLLFRCNVLPPSPLAKITSIFQDSSHTPPT